MQELVPTLGITYFLVAYIPLGVFAFPIGTCSDPWQHFKLSEEQLRQLMNSLKR